MLLSNKYLNSLHGVCVYYLHTAYKTEIGMCRYIIIIFNSSDFFNSIFLLLRFYIFSFLIDNNNNIIIIERIFKERE